MVEIDIMKRYPKSVRDNIIKDKKKVSNEDIKIARQFGKEYFDGERWQGLGGYYYNSKYFTPVVEDFISHYGLTDESKILDVGCGKGFMLHDFKKALPNVSLAGIDNTKNC